MDEVKEVKEHANELAKTKPIVAFMWTMIGIVCTGLASHFLNIPLGKSEKYDDNQIRRLEAVELKLETVVRKQDISDERWNWIRDSFGKVERAQEKILEELSNRSEKK